MMRHFTFQFTAPNQRNVIYVYADLAIEEVLDVGHTGQFLKTRLLGYAGWLNGRRTRDINRPARLKWLTCFIGRARIEVWAKASSADIKERAKDESHWISKLRPVLNVRA